MHPLQEACRQWLLAKEHNAEDIIDTVVLEQLIVRLLKETTELVKCQHLASLDGAVGQKPSGYVSCCRQAPLLQYFSHSLFLSFSLLFLSFPCFPLLNHLYLHHGNSGLMTELTASLCTGGIVCAYQDKGKPWQVW